MREEENLGGGREADNTLDEIFSWIRGQKEQNGKD